MVEPPQKKGRGFSALDEWASDLERAQEEVEKSASPQAMLAEQPARQSADCKRPEPHRPTARTPAQSSTRPLKNIGIGIGLWTGSILLLAVILTASLKPKQKAVPPRPAVAQQPTPATFPQQAPPAQWQQAPPPGLVWEDEQPKVPTVTKRKSEIAVDDAVADSGEEIAPPIGVNHILGPAEVRYCVYEKIRLGGMERNVNERSEAEVDAFNEAVDDYNARCGSFRYRRGLLQRIRESAEGRRFSLELEGAQRLDLVR